MNNENKIPNNKSNTGTNKNQVQDNNQLNNNIPDNNKDLSNNSNEPTKENLDKEDNKSNDNKKSNLLGLFLGADFSSVSSLIKSVAKRKLLLLLAGLGGGGCLLSIAIFSIVLIAAPMIMLGIINTDSSSSNSSNLNSGYSYTINGTKYSNIKVRLLNCEGNTAIAGEELIDFETYVLGVVYQEIGDLGLFTDSNGNTNYEAIKAQAVAVRSYSLTRPQQMNGGFGVTLTSDGNQNILSLRSCTNDQAFCNPEKGCWSNVAGGQTSVKNKDNWSNCTIYSGYDTTKTWTRTSLSEDSLIRKAVEETKGEVLLNSSGEIVYTTYIDKTTNKFIELAKEGKDYFSILVKVYQDQDAKSISSDYTAPSNYSYSSYVEWMVNIANDNTHGYSQARRTFNPDIDCSSFVYYALINAGGFSTSQLGTYPFTTRTMSDILTSNGFTAHKFTGLDNLQEGDILWRSGHTEVYAGAGKTVGAHGCSPTNSHPNRSCSTSGDQDDEVSVSSAGTNWTYYFRYGS